MTDTNIVSYEIAGKRYDIDLFDLDGIEWRDVKLVTRRGQYDALHQALAGKDFECIAALLWVWRRRDEPALTYEAVLSSLKFHDIAKGPTRGESTSPPG